MPKFPRKTVFLAALCATMLSQAFAQSAPSAPAASAPLLEHKSAFEGYRSFAAEEIQPWRQSNDAVRDIGGWRVYAREISGVSAPAAGAPAKPADAVMPTPGRTPADPHGGHAK